MKTKLIAALCGFLLAAPSFAQQVSIPLKPADVTSGVGCNLARQEREAGRF
jgi:hypothetical protein